MAKCHSCQAETELHAGGIPTCVTCVVEIEKREMRAQGSQQPQSADRDDPAGSPRQAEK